MLNQDQHTALLMIIADQHIGIINLQQEVNELKRTITAMKEQDLSENGIKHAPV